MDTNYRLFQVGPHWVCKYLAIHIRFHQILEDSAFGQLHKELGNMLRKAYHLCQVGHECRRMGLAADNHLHQIRRYKPSVSHYMALDTMMGILYHPFP